MLLIDLVEGREDFIVQQFGDRIVDRFYQDTGAKMDAKYIVTRLAHAGRKYLNWIVKQYLAGQFKYEDISRLKQDIAEFDRVKSKLENKDINQYKNLLQLYKALEPFEDQEIISNKQLEKNIKTEGATKIYEDSTASVYKLHNKEAACLLGRGTRWCTAATKGDNAFGQYASRGPLYVVMSKRSNQKFQFHLESGQYMDENDYPIDVDKFVKQYPKVADAIVLDNPSGFSQKVDEQILPTLSEETKIKVVKQLYWIMGSIPKDERTEKLCMAAWESHPAAYYYFPDKLKNLKMSLETAKRIKSKYTDMYIADIVPKEHMETLRDYFAWIPHIRRNSRHKRDGEYMLRRLESARSTITPEHKEEFEELIQNYKDQIKKADDMLKKASQFMKGLKQKLRTNTP